MNPNSDRAKNLALALLAMTQFVVVIDASIVNVALPSIGKALHFSQDNLTWVVNAYTLTFGGFLLLGGRLADLMGRRRMFMLGLVVFSLASLLGGLAQSEAWLIAARAVQGLGAAIVSPAALSIITTTFSEGAERNRALGVWGSVAGAGGAAGVLLGGVLTSGLSWRWVLFVNVPIGVICVLLSPRLLQPLGGRDAQLRHTGRDRRHGWSGAARLRARQRRQRGLGIDRNGAADRRRDRAAGRVPGDRAALASAAHAVLHLSSAHAARRRHGRTADRHVAVLDVLLHLALHAAGAALLGAARRAVLPAAGLRDHHLCRRGVGRRHTLRLQADPVRRAAVRGRRSVLVLACARHRRNVRGRRAGALDPRRNRPRPLVRARWRPGRKAAPRRPSRPAPTIRPGRPGQPASRRSPRYPDSRTPGRSRRPAASSARPASRRRRAGGSHRAR